MGTSVSGGSVGSLRLCGVELLRDAQTLGTLPRTEGGLGGVRRKSSLEVGQSLKKKQQQKWQKSGDFFGGREFFVCVLFLLTLDVKSGKRCQEGSKMAVKLIHITDCMYVA